ncbi:MAG: RNA polymerase sigma-70 factor [Sphingobacterium sp.]|jgi:RNA polymerase sigma-70 factor (ECF subfamily)|nr:RNA polymerase sigma-70 factor [Sphingobacterium sp.]
MNTSYIGIIKPIEIHDMQNAFVEKDWEEPVQARLLLTEKLLDELFQEHYSFLCHVAMKIVKDSEAAKDIVQNFFLYCWEKRSSVKIQGSFRNYAYRSVRNASMNHLKRAIKVNYDSDYITNEAAENLTYQSDSERKILENERENKLWKVIDQLPDKRRTIFLLSQREGLTYGQIAENMDISVNTVKTQIKLAYVFLRTECRWIIGIISWLFLIK